MPVPSPRSRVRLRRIARALGPAMPRPQGREPLRASLGAGLALLLCGLLLWGAGGAGGLVLIAPLGASAFLLFVLPNSPLAQPWSAVVGNTASALLALGVARLGLPLPLAAGLAVGGAVLLMAALRAMHPPGGAVALATVLSPALVGELGFRFALAPVLLDTAALVALAMLWNRLTGRRYPFRQPRERQADRTHLSTAEMERLLQRLNQSANIGTEDFARLLAAAEAEVEARAGRAPSRRAARSSAARS